MRYANKIVIVTGGSKGIGQGCVGAFVEAGATVVFCARQPGEARAWAKKLTERGPGQAVFMRADVSRKSDIAALIEETTRRFGGIDCLVNNAGWHPPHQAIDAFSEEDFEELLRLNLLSVFTASRLALPFLRQARGNIINVSSLVGEMGQRQAVTYVATKGAVTALTKALAIDEAPQVRVNVVLPGNVYTPLWQEAIDAARDRAACRREGEAAQPLGRMGTIEEAGKLVLFIAAEATFCTGTEFYLTGGAELGYGRKAFPPESQSPTR